MAVESELFREKSSYFHSLGKVNTESNQAVYESLYKASHSLFAEDIYYYSVDYCVDETAADAYVAAHPDKVTKYTLQPLTEVFGSNGEAWYIDIAGTFIRPILLPTDVPNDTTNLPSYGFDVKLYKADGTRIPPTSGVWVVDGYSGIIRFQKGYTPADLGWGIPKITCYIYTGESVYEIIANPIVDTIITTEGVLTYTLSAAPIYPANVSVFYSGLKLLSGYTVVDDQITFDEAVLGFSIETNDKILVEYR